MSKLAARLADARRSGVYRVESTDAIEEAAAVNAFSLARFALDTIEVSALESLSTRALARSADGQVLLFSGFEELIHDEPGALDPLLSALEAAASKRRASGLRYFAAFVDPAAMLPLAPLYKPRQHAPNGRSGIPADQ